MRKLNFKKESNGDWFIVLKTWPGPKSALQMVLGADTLLDMLSKDGKTVEVELMSEAASRDFVAIKDTKTPTTSGRWYNVFRDGVQVHRMWLCPVTRFVFMGRYPGEIKFSA
ncbi:MAG: DUF6717 family protein [Bacteroidota bacterium]